MTPPFQTQASGQSLRRAQALFQPRTLPSPRPGPGHLPVLPSSCFGLWDPGSPVTSRLPRAVERLTVLGELLAQLVHKPNNNNCCSCESYNGGET